VSHPMEPWLDARRAESSRYWDRVRDARKKLASVPLSAFTADYALDICRVMEGGRSDEEKSRKSLERIEAFFTKRRRKARKRK
jgi:hypothetical protein